MFTHSKSVITWLRQRPRAPFVFFLSPPFAWLHAPHRTYPQYSQLEEMSAVNSLIYTDGVAITHTHAHTTDGVAITHTHMHTPLMV